MTGGQAQVGPRPARRGRIRLARVTTELMPGLHHWTALHPGIGSRVSSYYVAPAAAVIDPIEPEDGWDALPGRPEVILLSTGLHDRGAGELAERLGIPIRTSAEAARRLGDALPVEVDAVGTEVAPGITSIHIGALCPDEGAFHVAVGDGAISFADGLVGFGGKLGFVPDFLIGDDAPAIKRRLAQAFAALPDEYAFDHLLLAHGEPVIGGGREALSAFARSVLDQAG